MSYANFKPTIWSKYIQHEIEKDAVFEKGCNYQFEGEAKKGEKVKILGVTRPKIGNYTGADIGAPEAVPTTGQFLEMTEAKFFNFLVDDVDKAQAQEGLMQSLMQEATRAMADERDTFIASLAAKATYKSDSLAITNKDEAKAVAQKALVALMDHGVKSGRDQVEILVPPVMYMLLWDSIIHTKTQNDANVANGMTGNYAGCKITMTANCHNDGTDFHMMFKTGKAIAFCGGINEVEAYRPEGLFADAVKGLNVFGGKIVRQKELYVVKAHFA